jgi:hypothetical protein
LDRIPRLAHLAEKPQLRGCEDDVNAREMALLTDGVLQDMALYLHGDDRDDVESLRRAGEWEEAMENLLVLLSRDDVPVTSDQYARLQVVSHELGMAKPQLRVKEK